MQRIVLCVCVVLALVIAGASVATADGDAAKGKPVYMTKCASCHGADGTPKEAIAKALKVEMRHLGAKEVLAKKDAKMKKDTVEGIGKMKGVKLSDEDAANVIAFMRTLKKEK